MLNTGYRITVTDLHNVILLANIIYAYVPFATTVASYAKCNVYYILLCFSIMCITRTRVVALLYLNRPQTYNRRASWFCDVRPIFSFLRAVRSFWIYWKLSHSLGAHINIRLNNIIIIPPPRLVLLRASTSLNLYGWPNFKVWLWTKNKYNSWFSFFVPTGIVFRCWHWVRYNL